MAGSPTHEFALKQQNMTYDERAYNLETKRKKKSNTLADKRVMQEGDTSLTDMFNIYQHGMELPKKLGRPMCYASVDRVIEEVNNFILYCQEHNIVPLNSGLSLWLGIDRVTLNEWKNDSSHPFSQILKKADELFLNFTQQKTLDGKINPILFMFLSKQFWGYTDKTEIVHRSSNNGTIDLSEQQRIIQSTPGIVIDAEFKEKGRDLDGRGDRDLESSRDLDDQRLKDLETYTHRDLVSILSGDSETYTHRDLDDQKNDQRLRDLETQKEDQTWIEEL